MPAMRLTSLTGKSITFAGSGTSPATVISLGVPPQRSITIRVASSSPGTMNAGSTPRSKRWRASESIAEPAAGAGDVERLPQRRFDQHVGRGLVAAGRLAAHDAGDRFDAGLVGDDADVRVERVGLAVERHHRLARRARAGR